MGQAAHAARMRGEGEHLRQHRQAFLRHRGGRRSLAQEGTNRLMLSVPGGAEVDPAFMHFQYADVAQREAGILAQFDVIAAGGGVGDNAVRKPDAHRRGILKEVAQTLRQNTHRLGGIEHRLGRRRMSVAHQIVQRAGERDSQVAKTRIAGVKAFRGTAIKTLRESSERGGAAVDKEIDDLSILRAHACHDSARGVVLSQTLPDAALDALEILGACVRDRRARDAIGNNRGGQEAVRDSGRRRKHVRCRHPT